MVRARPLPPAVGPPPFRRYQPATPSRGPASGFAPRGTVDTPAPRLASPPPPRLVPTVTAQPACRPAAPVFAPPAPLSVRQATAVDVAVEIEDVVCEDDDVQAAPTISPELLSALRAIAPRKRRSKGLYVVVLLLVAAIPVVLRSGPARELALSSVKIMSSQVHAWFGRVEGFPQNGGKVEPGRP